MSDKRREDIPTDAEIAAAFKHYNFGTNDQDRLKKILQCNVLKRLAGYHCASSMHQIQSGLGLVTNKGTVTVRGKMFIFDAYFEQTYS